MKLHDVYKMASKYIKYCDGSVVVIITLILKIVHKERYIKSRNTVGLKV